MAHYAQLDINSKVIQIIAIADRDNMDSNNCECEAIGKAFCKSLVGGENWVKTSYNGKIRKKFASIGDTYDKELDAFIPPRPELEGIALNKETCLWEPIIPMPNDGEKYRWDSKENKWEKIIVPELPKIEDEVKNPITDINAPILPPAASLDANKPA